jgi:hypothetical protein
MRLRHYIQGFVIALAAVPALAADVDGKWKTSIEAGPQGRMSIIPGTPAVLIGYSGKLKGDELSLTASLDMGQGPMAMPVVATRIK